MTHFIMNIIRPIVFASFAVAASPVRIAKGEEQPSSQPDKPNVVLILADDSGFSDLGCYGGEIHTPNLDKLAADGLRFTQMYNTARCWPTRSCLLTGYYYEQTTSTNFPAWVRTLPKRLGETGYRCFHTGKWHVKISPEAAGFLSVREIPKAAAGAWPATDGDLDFDYPSSEAITEAALHFLDDHSKKHANRPFFLNMAYYAPHFPVRALEKDIAEYKGAYDAGWEEMQKRRGERLKELGIVNCAIAPMEKSLVNNAATKSHLPQYGPGEITEVVPWDTLTSEQKRFQAMKMEIHAAMVSRMDAEIGRVIGKLKGMGVFESTLIVFLSDNGASPEIMIRGKLGHDPQARPGSQETEYCIGPAWATACNTPFRYYKMKTHEGGIATPGIFHWPKGIAAMGELRHVPAHCVDIVSTIYDLAGLPPPDGIHGAPPSPGRSLVPAFNKDVGSLHDELFFRHQGKALRVGNLKITSSSATGDKWALFDMTTDRCEQVDVSASMPEVKERMVKRWNELYENYERQSGTRKDAKPGDTR